MIVIKYNADNIFFIVIIIIVMISVTIIIIITIVLVVSITTFLLLSSSSSSLHLFSMLLCMPGIAHVCSGKSGRQRKHPKQLHDGHTHCMPVDICMSLQNPAFPVAKVAGKETPEATS